MALSSKQARMGALAVALGASLWGTWKLWLIGPALDSSAQGGVALTASGVLASSMALFSRRSWPDVSRQVWIFLVLFGVAEAINCALFFLALSFGDTASAVTTHYLAPVIVAVVAPMLGEPVGRRARPAALLAFLATLVLVGAGNASAGSKSAALAGAASAIFYAACVFLAKRVSGPLRPWEVVGFHNLIAGLLMFSISRTPVTRADARELGFALIGAVLAGCIASGLYIFGMTRIPASRAAILAYLEPVSASLIGALVLKEKVGLVQLGAMGVILTAGVLVALEPAAPAPSSLPAMAGEGG
jgi:drug/metabolite transporter (DMT)-like permease